MIYTTAFFLFFNMFLVEIIETQHIFRSSFQYFNHWKRKMPQNDLVRYFIGVIRRYESLTQKVIKQEKRTWCTEFEEKQTQMNPEDKKCLLVLKRAVFSSLFVINVIIKTAKNYRFMKQTEDILQMYRSFECIAYLLSSLFLENCFCFSW